MVHRIVRLFSYVFIVAGVALLASWAWQARAPREFTAPLLRADDDAAESYLDAGSPERAEFNRGDLDDSETDLSIELLAVRPYAEGAIHDRISVTEDSIEATHALEPGIQFDIGGETYRVAGVRTWQGLLSMTDGAPMVSVSLLHAEQPAVENLLLRTGQRVEIGDDLTLELRECASREAALDAISVDAGTAPRGRWGIADGVAVIWFDSFTPGTGATLSDGSLVTLESFSPEGPSIAVRKNSSAGVEIIRADGPSNSPPLFLEYDAVAPQWISLFVCEDGKIIVGGPAPAELDVGEVWRAPAAGYSLRLEQALKSAAPVMAGDSPFFEAVLESNAGRVRVRQGEAVRVGDALVRYLREPDNATASFESRLNAAEHDDVVVDLRPAEHFVFAWRGNRWLLGHAHIRPGESITIIRDRGSGLDLFGGLVFIATGLVLLLKRRRPPAD